jgi:hypothetical protein
MTETGVKAIWNCRVSYVYFKGQIHGIKSIPMEKESGHCPSIRLDHIYLDRNEHLQTMTHKQFKYLLKKFEKEICEQGFEDYVLEFGGLFMQKESEVTQNLYQIYKELSELFDKSAIFDWHRTDVKLHLKTELFSSTR